MGLIRGSGISLLFGVREEGPEKLQSAGGADNPRYAPLVQQYNHRFCLYTFCFNSESDLANSADKPVFLCLLQLIFNIKALFCLIFGKINTLM